MASPDSMYQITKWPHPFFCCAYSCCLMCLQIRRLSLHSNRVSGIGEIYNVINRLESFSEEQEDATPIDLWPSGGEEGSGSVSSVGGASKEEQLYDTLEGLMENSLPVMPTSSVQTTVSPVHETYATIGELTESTPPATATGNTLAPPTPSVTASLASKSSPEASLTRVSVG